MSDAGVEFETLTGDPAAAGAEQTFRFNCPKHRGRMCGSLIIVGRTSVQHDPQNQGVGKAQWTWENGDRDKPTFTPSVNCMGCWHGYIRDGRCVGVNGNDEPEP